MVTVTPVGDRTEATITERTTTSDFMLRMSRMGLEQCLDKMGAIFSNEERPPG